MTGIELWFSSRAPPSTVVRFIQAYDWIIINNGHREMGWGQGCWVESQVRQSDESSVSSKDSKSVMDSWALTWPLLGEEQQRNWFPFTRWINTLYSNTFQKAFCTTGTSFCFIIHRSFMVRDTSVTAVRRVDNLGFKLSQILLPFYIFKFKPLTYHKASMRACWGFLTLSVWVTANGWFGVYWVLA